MILPSKNIDLDQSPILAGAIAILELKNGNTSMDGIFKKFRKEFPDHYWVIGLRALNILFLSGAIEYDQVNDRLELKK